MFVYGLWTDKKERKKENINGVGYRVAAQLKIGPADKIN